jgi:hypothetical protein
VCMPRSADNQVTQPTPRGPSRLKGPEHVRRGCRGTGLFGGHARYPELEASHHVGFCGPAGVGNPGWFVFPPRAPAVFRLPSSVFRLPASVYCLMQLQGVQQREQHIEGRPGERERDIYVSTTEVIYGMARGDSRNCQIWIRYEVRWAEFGGHLPYLGI